MEWKFDDGTTVGAKLYCAFILPLIMGMINCYSGAKYIKMRNRSYKNLVLEVTAGCNVSDESLNATVSTKSPNQVLSGYSHSLIELEGNNYKGNSHSAIGLSF